MRNAVLLTTPAAVMADDIRFVCTAVDTAQPSHTTMPTVCCNVVMYCVCLSDCLTVYVIGRSTRLNSDQDPLD